MLKVFISWSRPRSQAVAQALYDWLPTVIQSVKPWMSAAEIEKGARWLEDIMQELTDTHFGIVCLTPENLEAPWLTFEAGAIAKSIDRSFVCPYLLDLEYSQVTGPLVQFQSTKANQEDTRKLVLSINHALGPDAIPDDRLIRIFDKMWPDLQEKLDSIPVPEDVPSPKRTEKEMLVEILDLVRAEARERKEVVNPTPAYPTLHDLAMLVSGVENTIFSRTHLNGRFKAEVTSNSDGIWFHIYRGGDHVLRGLTANLEAAKRAADNRIQRLEKHNCEAESCSYWSNVFADTY